MTLVFALLFLGAGIAIIVNTVMSPGARGQGFPRYEAPRPRSRRIVPVAVGLVIALGGAALLLVSNAEPPDRAAPPVPARDQ